MTWLEPQVFLYLKSDEQHQKMIEVWRACEAAGVELPEKVRSYFCNERPTEQRKITLGDLPAYYNSAVSWSISREFGSLLLMPFVFEGVEAVEFVFCTILPTDKTLSFNVEAVYENLEKYRKFLEVKRICREAKVTVPDEVSYLFEQQILSMVGFLVDDTTEFSSSVYGYSNCASVVFNKGDVGKVVCKIDTTKLPSRTKTLHIKWEEK